MIEKAVVCLGGASIGWWLFLADFPVEAAVLLLVIVSFLNYKYRNL